MSQALDSQSTSLTVAKDVSSGTTLAIANPPEDVTKLDIEHVVVEDDPRLWSDARKNMVLLIISGASVIGGLSASIQNPANANIEQELHTTASEISLSLALFILAKGTFLSCGVQSLVYLLSIAIFTVASAIVAVSKNIGLVIGMRILQGAGSSAAMAIGAATLADIYEPHQRGTMMGVYYSAPLMGPSLGPIIGGGLAQGLTWRAIFWFLVIWGGVIFLAFLLLFKDTFRKERSLACQTVLKKHIQELTLTREKHTIGGKWPAKKMSVGKDSEMQTFEGDVEEQLAVASVPAINEVKLSIMDVNPFPPYIWVLSRRNNVCVLISSGLFLAFLISVTYTCAQTLSLYYDYDAMAIGLVLLSYGIGSVVGSILGGRWSDRTLARLKAANGGVSYPEMRLESTKVAMWWFPPSIVGYAWACQQHVHVSAICVMLFLSGFFSIWIYASMLAYLVDANIGRSSSVVATNSSFRGLFAFVATEIAIPLQNAIRDGGLYTLWVGLILLAELMVLLVLWKGKQWREASIDAEKRRMGT